MHRNYFLFEQQTNYLNNKLKGSIVTSCFTHRKDELVLALQSDQEYFLRIGVNTRLPYLLLYSPIKIKEPSIKFFDKILNKKLTSFQIHPFDKKVIIQIEINSLQITFYGKNPNVILLDSSKSFSESFKKIKYLEEQEVIETLINPTESSLEDYLNLIKSTEDLLLENFIMKYINGWNKLLAKEVCYRISINSKNNISHLSRKNWDTLRNKTLEMTNEIRSKKPAIYFLDEQAKHLSLVELKHLGKDYQTIFFDSVNDSWKKFLYHFDKEKTIEKISYQVNQALSKRIGYLNRTLKKITNAEKLKTQKEEAELKGNLLLTFIAEIPKGKKEVKLQNIFSENNETVTIKLNSSRSVQENAQKYFEKFKNIDEKKLQLGIKKDTYLKEYDLWEKIYNDNKNITSLRQAEKIKKLLIEKNILKSSEFKQPNQEFSFKHVLLGNQWDIYIGKNARNNDLLTFKFAHKFDLWFHAQGVSGSHVIIHLSNKNQIPPKEIIEQAASIAAYNSGAKNSSIVPVNYTEVRYVRKPHKSSAGTVVISHEKSIFIKPIKFI